jgi:hypothetical protein
LREVKRIKFLDNASRHVVVSELFPYVMEYYDGEHSGTYNVNSKPLTRKLSRFKYANLKRSGRYRVLELDGTNECCFSLVPDDYGSMREVFEELSGLAEEE